MVTSISPASIIINKTGNITKLGNTKQLNIPKLNNIFA